MNTAMNNSVNNLVFSPYIIYAKVIIFYCMKKDFKFYFCVIGGEELPTTLNRETLFTHLLGIFSAFPFRRVTPFLVFESRGWPNLCPVLRKP